MWGRSPNSLGRRKLGPHGVVPAVDMHQLAGGHIQIVRKQGHDSAADRSPVLQIPAQRRPYSPHLFKILEARDATRSHRGERSRANGVDANLVTAEIARQITSHRL